MEIIDGKKISQKILGSIKKEIADQKLRPGLAVVLVGDDDASRIYVDLKEKAANDCGVGFFKFEFDGNADEQEVIKKIEELNHNEKIDGIIVQLPLPKKLNTQRIIETVFPKKDVDGFHPVNVDNFFKDKTTLDPVFPRAIVKMIEHASRERKEQPQNAIIVVNSEKFGKVMSKALSRKGIESKFVLCKDVMNAKKDDAVRSDFAERDIVITACGAPNILLGDMVKDDAIIIDGGIKKIGKKVIGDVDFESFKKTNCFVTPVPGGVGPVTVACLLENVYLVSA